MSDQNSKRSAKFKAGTKQAINNIIQTIISIFNKYMRIELDDPKWGGIAAIAGVIAAIGTIIGIIVAVLALFFTIYTYFSNGQKTDPIITPTTSTNITTATATFTENSATPSLLPPTNAVTSVSSTATLVYITSTPTLPTGNLAIPVILNHNPKVYLTAFDGEGINGPTPISLDAQQPMFSLDGSSILVKATVDGKSGIHELTSSGFTGLFIDHPNAEWPVFSPDGQAIIFSNTKLDFGLHRKKVNKDTEEIFLNSRSIFARNLLWSTDNQLVFQGCATWLDEADNCGIWITDADNLDPHRIVENKNAYPMSTREDLLVYMAKKGRYWDIYSISLNGGDPINLTDNDFQDGVPVISPDGVAIAYISNELGKWGVWTMNVDGRNKKHWFEINVDRGFIDTEEWPNQRMGWR